MEKTVCVIPARMGSKRLAKKNLRLLGGVSLLVRAIRKAQSSQVFDEVWVSSESEILGRVASAEGALFHVRRPELGSDEATSEDFLTDFMEVHDADWIIQLHSIAPLLTVEDIQQFITALKSSDDDVRLTVVAGRLETIFGGKPVNFSFGEKTNSQLLEPVSEIVWAISAWKKSVFLEAIRHGKCATYAGKVGFHALPRIAGHVIKTEFDLQMAEALLPLAATRGNLT